MLSLPLVIANADPGLFLLEAVAPVWLLIRIISMYLDFRSCRRQGKRWTWYKQLSVIHTLLTLPIVVSCELIAGMSSHIIPENAFTKNITLTGILASAILWACYIVFRPFRSLLQRAKRRT